MENVIQTLLKIRELVFQTFNQTLGYFTEEYSCFACWVKECGVRVCEELLRQHVQHLVYDLRWSEHFVVGEVCQTGQHVRVVHIFK